MATKAERPTQRCTSHSPQPPAQHYSYLSEALQRSEGKQPVRPELGSQRGEQGEDGSAQNTQTQEDTPPVVTRQVAPRDLRAQVAEEEGAQQPALSLRVPRVLRDLGQEDGEREHS